MGVTFMASSGAEAIVADPGVARQIVWQMTPAIGGSTAPCRLGFFGDAGHGDSVLLTTWSNSVYIVDRNGNQPSYIGSGVFVPMKWIDDNTVFISGIYGGIGWDWAINQAHRVPPESGTLLIRFEEPTQQAVQTLNASFRSVAVTSDDVVTDETVGADSTEIKIKAFETGRFGFDNNNAAALFANPHMDGANLTGSDTWENIDDSAADNQLDLDDHSWEAPIHDFSVVVSVSPQQTGGINDFGFLFRLDFV